eukprot:1728255-Rhodomonas_salina.3
MASLERRLETFHSWPRAEMNYHKLAQVPIQGTRGILSEVPSVLAPWYSVPPTHCILRYPRYNGEGYPWESGSKDEDETSVACSCVPWSSFCPCRRAGVSLVVWSENLLSGALSGGRWMQAGFFYAPIQGCPDRCIMFATGNALFNWDPDDDPWYERADRRTVRLYRR